MRLSSCVSLNYFLFYSHMAITSRCEQFVLFPPTPPSLAPTESIVLKRASKTNPQPFNAGVTTAIGIIDDYYRTIVVDSTSCVIVIKQTTKILRNRYTWTIYNTLNTNNNRQSDVRY